MPKASAIETSNLKISFAIPNHTFSSFVILVVPSNLFRASQMYPIFALGTIEHQSLFSETRTIQQPLMSGPSDA